MAKKNLENYAEETISPSHVSRRFPILGVGASAGGLEALREFLGAMPNQPDFAVVVVQHMARDRPSLTQELLSRCTKMEVSQVAHVVTVQPNHVYVIPPAHYLTIANGHLNLVPMESKRDTPLVIDRFLRSLAVDQQQYAVGVILSGSGSDGALGVKAIHEVGGLVIAQDPGTAQHDGMPQRAIETGAVDQILAPAAIPAAIKKFAEYSHLHESSVEPQEPENAEPSDLACRDPDANALAKHEPDDLSFILKLLHEHGSCDFRNYKQTTLLRRTRRRMCLLHMNGLTEYESYLKENPTEVEALAKDLLISVTEFFRDPDAWKELATSVIPKIVEAKDDTSPNEKVRVWIPACATGEEAYTVTILILEEIRRQKKSIAVQVFASDIDRTAITVARAGRYPSSIESAIATRQLSRYFTIKDGDTHYQVGKSLRECIVFAVQDMISDPPFSQMDLICCRNVLIYLKQEMQQRLIALFHFALRERGCLMLGSAETIGRKVDIFENVNKHARIYRATSPKRNNPLDFPVKLGTQQMPTDGFIPLPRRDLSLTQLAQQKLLELTGPTAILIDDRWRLLYINGDVDPYLTHRDGIPSDDLLNKLRPSLRSKLRIAIRSAFSDNQSVSTVCRVQNASETHLVQVHVFVMKDDEEQPPMALIVFEPLMDDSIESTTIDATTIATPNSKPMQRAGLHDTSLYAEIESNVGLGINEERIIKFLESELTAAKDDLQLTIEQFEVSSEEFKASNEEVLSINEELQSTNEELETSKEELQSLNEELATVNHQLGLKVAELESKHADLENLIAATEIATICLDTDMTIRWFTDAAKNLIRMRPSDCGRPLSELTHDFSDDDLLAQCVQVLHQLAPTETEVTTTDGRGFIRKIVPYLSGANQIGGVVITLLDITNRKKREVKLRANQERLRRALSVDGIGVLFFDKERTVIDCNDWFLTITGYTRREREAGQVTSDSLTPPQWTDLTKAQWETLASSGRLGPYETEFRCKDGSLRWIMLSGCSLEDGTTVVHCIDIADRKQTEISLRNSEEQMRLAASAARLGWYSYDVENDLSEWSPELRSLNGIGSDEPITFERIMQAIHPDDRERFAQHQRSAIEAMDCETPNRNVYEGEFRIVRADGEIRWLVDRGMILHSEEVQPRPTRAVGMVMDVTDRKKAEWQLHDLNKSLEHQVEHRTELLNLLQQVTRIANEASSVEDAMCSALAKISTFNGWSIGHVWRRVDSESGEMETSGFWYIRENDFRDIEGLEKFKELTRRTRIRAGEGLIGRVLRSGEAQWSNDIGTSELSNRHVPELALHAAIAFPIMIDGVTVAVMELYSNRSLRPQHRFMEILPDIGIQLGYAVQRKRMERIVAEIAIEEQRRIGRELHDGIAQQLTGGAMIAESLRQSLSQGQAKQLENATFLVEIFKSTHDDVRSLSSGLMLGAFESQDLMEKLMSLSRDVSRRFSVPCVFDDKHADNFFVCNDATASAILHVAREAMHNAVKHAQANRITVIVSTNEVFELVIQDDGVGFDETQKKNTNGLRIMNYRAESVGGKFKINSSPNHGTTIKLIVPRRNCQS